MKKIILISMMLIAGLSSYSQSKKELGQKLNILSLKMETLVSKIDAQDTRIDALIQKNSDQAKEITRLENKVNSLHNGTQQSQTNESSYGSKSVTEKPVSNGQCKAITSSGKQCSRKAQEGSEYCWQHAKTYDPTSTSPKESSTRSNIKSSSESRSSYSGSQNIQTGPRGGKYYINSKGNKTYIKR